MITGKHLINGDWTEGPTTSQSTPLTGKAFTIHNASLDVVNKAAEAAQLAHHEYAFTTSSDRAKLLRTIADEINLRGDEISAVCEQETGLPLARLTGERGRTTQQLEMFANYIETGDYLQRSTDQALPERSPIPRPELRKMQRSLGPVAVFGASNFPLAFSAAGGDTASALAAGCPVVVKGHPAHPATSELVAQAILSALTQCNMNPGIFALIQDSGIQAAQDLVTHPHIKAVGFTGSLQAGRALFDLCNQRPSPIPFFGEMGSLNPVFVMPQALKQSAAGIAAGWVDSLNLGTGQFCTKPGLLILPKGDDGDAFIQAAQHRLASVAPSHMLTQGIARAFHAGVSKVANTATVDTVFEATAEADLVSPQVFSTDTHHWLNTQSLHEEIFGPFAIIIRTENHEDMLAVAHNLEGQLTATLFMQASDHNQVQPLARILEQKAGRLLANGYPTGVEVASSMVHGGPYPACTFTSSTSVGTSAIQRFLRPVCYQNMPEELLPEELRHQAS